MSDMFGFLDAIFGDDGAGSSSTQGSPHLNQGFAPVAGWMVGQAFTGAGPLGQYFGMVYGSPGTGIPSVRWGTGYEDADFSVSPDPAASGGHRSYAGGDPVAGREDPTDAPARPLEFLDRDAPGSGSGRQAPIDVVTVFGSPPDRPRRSNDWFLNAPPSTPGTYSGPEIKIRWPDPPPPRPARRRPPAARSPLPADATSPTPSVEESQPERDPYDQSPTPDAAYRSQRANPWGSDAARPDDLVAWGSWERLDDLPVMRPERGDPGRVENVSTVPIERTFWSRGGVGLVGGAVSVGLGVAALMWWNPVGWFAMAGVALALAGGVAASTASAVELSSSYAGVTTAENDAAMNRAVGATLGYTSVGGVVGGALGTVLADDAAEGFERGAMWGGLVESGVGVGRSLPGALRAAPGLAREAGPWAKSLLITPLWFVTSASPSGGGSLRALARAFAAQGRIARRVARVEYLGTTPLVERNAAWARFQVGALGTRREGIFRVTYANGQQRIILADAAPAMRGRPSYPLDSTAQAILEAKYGTMGQMFNLEREGHIMRQVNDYLDITGVTGGRVGYVVSTELGAQRLAQRFGRDFPAQMESGQLWVEWRPWP